MCSRSLLPRHGHGVLGLEKPRLKSPAMLQTTLAHASLSRPWLARPEKPSHRPGDMRCHLDGRLVTEADLPDAHLLKLSARRAPAVPPAND